MAWSPEQLEAINTRGSNLLVAAAAGSGKTSVLVERIIRKVTDDIHPLDIDRLLVVTFTNAAAAEMRTRIGAALNQALLTAVDTHHLDRQLILLSTASISTMHAFCQGLIRQYFYLLDLDPKFRIASEAEIELLKGDVLEKLFEAKYMDGDNGFLQLADIYGDEDGDGSVQHLVLQLYEFSRSHPWPEHWLDGLSEPFDIPDGSAIDDTPWSQLIREKITYELEEGKRRLDGLISEALQPGAPAVYADTFRSDKYIVEQIIQAAAVSWRALEAAFSGAEFEKIAKADSTAAKDIKDKLQKERNKVKDKVKKLRERYFCQASDCWLEDMRKAAPNVTALASLVKSFSRTFTDAKRSKGILDFNDLEHFALKILLDPSSSPEMMVPSVAARTLQGRFEEVMVDEYQDINNVQEAILRLVSSWDRPNRFMVGDVKQSIYRFRLAEPSLFMHKYHSYRSGEEAGERRVDLSRNYRSREEIIDAVNFLFSQLMTERAAELNYGEAERLYPGPGYPPVDGVLLAAGAVELHLLDADSAPDNEPGASGETAGQDESVGDETPRESGEAELTGFEKEARLIAARIRELRESGCHVYDKESKEYRQVSWRDIVILLRSVKGKANILLEALRQLDIPSYAELDAGYFKETEVQIIVSLLSIIDNPRQDIPLAGVLRSPVGGFSASDLAEIRLCRTGADLWDALQACCQDTSRPELAMRTEEFLAKLHHWRQLSRRIGVAELIWNIYRDSGYYDYVGGMPAGTLRQANLRAMYDRARQFEVTNYRGLFRFLRFIERLRGKGSDFSTARALGENEDVVRIMSIHKSKGLEFPVVIVADLGKGINLQDSKALVLCHKNLGVGPYIADPVLRYRYPTLARLAIQHKLNMETKAEELRILYVALTRAREKLILVGSAARLPEKCAAWCAEVGRAAIALPASLVASAKSYLDWVCPAVARHETGSVLRRYAGFIEQTHPIAAGQPAEWEVCIKSQDDCWEFESQPCDDGLLSKVKALEPVDASRSDEWVEQLLGWKYPFSPALGKPAKLTVTEIKRRLDDLDGADSTRWYQPAAITAKPRFLQDAGKLSAAEIGTAMHAVMQHIEYAKGLDADAVAVQVTEMSARDLLPVQTVQYIDSKAIAAFFASSLGKRVTAADWVKRELPFSLMLPAAKLYTELADTDEMVFVQGVIDCLFREQEGFVLIDYKTDVYDTPEELVLKYKVQLDIYAEAAQQILRLPVREKYIYAFAKQQVVRI